MSTINNGCAINLSKTMSGFFMGGVISFTMLGMSMVQLWSYLGLGKQGVHIDRLFMRYWVTSLVVMDFVSSCLITVHLHHYLVIKYGNCTASADWTPYFSLQSLLTIIIIFPVDLFFAQQIRALGQVHWCITALVVATALLAFLIGSGITLIPICTRGRAVLSLSVVNTLLTTANILCVVAELSATASIAYSLHRSKTGTRRADGILRKLFTWMITRGLLLSVNQILTMVFYFAQPSTTNWVPFQFFQSKLYIITMLSMLNSRKSLRKQMSRDFYPSGLSSALARSNSHDSRPRGLSEDISLSFSSHSHEESTFTNPRDSFQSASEDRRSEPTPSTKRNSFDQTSASVGLQSTRGRRSSSMKIGVYM